MRRFIDALRGKIPQDKSDRLEMLLIRLDRQEIRVNHPDYLHELRTILGNEHDEVVVHTIIQLLVDQTHPPDNQIMNASLRTLIDAIRGKIPQHKCNALEILLNQLEKREIRLSCDEYLHEVRSIIGVEHYGVVEHMLKQLHSDKIENVRRIATSINSDKKYLLVQHFRYCNDKQCITCREIRKRMHRKLGEIAAQGRNHYLPGK